MDIACQFILHGSIKIFFFPIQQSFGVLKKMIETGKTECLDRDIHIEIPQDRYGLHAIDMLDPDMVSFTP